MRRALPGAALLLLLGAPGAADPPPPAPPGFGQLAVHVVSAGTREPLAGATLRFTARAPVWADALVTRANEKGISLIDVPRFGGPVRILATAEGHLPRSGLAPGGGMVTLELLPVEAAHRVPVVLLDADDVPIAANALPAGAVLDLRVNGPAEQPEEGDLLEVPAGPALGSGLALPPGTARVMLRAPGWTSEQVLVDVPRDETATLHALPFVGPSLAGRVVDPTSGGGVAGARVVYEGFGARETTTDVAGRFSFPEVLLLDSHRLYHLVLRWAKEGGAGGRLEPYGKVQLERGQPPPEWTLPLPRARADAVLVEAPDGSPAARGVAWTASGAHDLRAEVVDGRLALVRPDGARADEPTVVAAREGIAILAPNAPIEGGRVRLRPWRLVRAKVETPEADEGAARTIRLLLQTQTTDVVAPSEPLTTLWGIPSEHDGHVAALVPDDERALLSIRAGRRHAVYRALDLVTEAPGTVVLPAHAEEDARAFTVVGADGAPLEARVRLRHRPRERDPRPLDVAWEVQTDEGGFATFDGPAGPYDVFLLEEAGPRTIAQRLVFGADDVTITLR
jgi:hypothetical protein